MWLPDGWCIVIEKTATGVFFKAWAKGIPEITSTTNFRSEGYADKAAKKALRSTAYTLQDSGWTNFRCHARIPGLSRAFCGANIKNTPNTKNAYSEQCGTCLKIVESIEREVMFR